MHVCTHILKSTPGHKRYTLPRTFYWARNGQTSLCRRLTACLGKKKKKYHVYIFSLNQLNIYTRVYFLIGAKQGCCNFAVLKISIWTFLCRKSYCMRIFIYWMAHKIHFPRKRYFITFVMIRDYSIFTFPVSLLVITLRIDFVLYNS